MADPKPITPTPALEYTQQFWGDSIYGTKEQIQALGVGVGLSFPGEIGCPRRRKMKVPDPRGFLAEIERADYRGEGLFYVAIPLFENHPRPELMAQQPYAPGVTKSEQVSSDEYCGTAEALVALGLVQIDQLPGQPGMRKVRVRILPDGSVLGGPPTANCAETRKLGAKEIERAGAGLFRVGVHVSAEEEQQRYARYMAARHEWEQRLQSLPRPAPLNEGRAGILARRTHLRLVWSTPECGVTT